MYYLMLVEYPEVMEDTPLFGLNAKYYILDNDYVYFLVKFMYFTYCRK